MTRSEEALKERARKRDRSVADQKRADSADMEKRETKLRKTNDNPDATTKPTVVIDEEKIQQKLAQKLEHEKDPALQEPGAWICVGCGNHNFASRHNCHSKMCDEKRPSGMFVPPRFKTNTRHDPATSKLVHWTAPQANPQQVAQNQDLRKVYLETKGEGMTQEDIDRAVILIARDERKKLKKENARSFPRGSKKFKTESEPLKVEPKTDTSEAPAVKPHDDEKHKNRSLKKKYLTTSGKGMSEADVDRAKLLIARAERKKQKQTAALQDAIKNVE